MSATGRGGPERVRGDVKLRMGLLRRVAEGPRPYRTVNEHGSLVLPSRRALTCGALIFLCGLMLGDRARLPW